MPGRYITALMMTVPSISPHHTPPHPTFSYKFNDLGMSDDDTLNVSLRMFMDFGLIEQFQIPYRVGKTCTLLAAEKLLLFFSPSTEDMKSPGL